MHFSSIIHKLGHKKQKIKEKVKALLSFVSTTYLRFNYFFKKNKKEF